MVDPIYELLKQEIKDIISFHYMDIRDCKSEKVDEMVDEIIKRVIDHQEGPQ